MGEMENLLILGSGCAGLTAAIYAARANLSPLVLEGVQPGGQLTTTSEVENFPGFPEGVDGFDLTDRMRKQAERFGARFAFAEVKGATLAEGANKLDCGSEAYECKSLIIATGASPRFLGVPGEKEMFGGNGVSSCATCDGAFYRGKEVVVLGGGDSAAEEALFLTRFATKVTLIHRRGELRASPIMAKRVVEHPKVAVAWFSVVEAMLADEKGKARAIRLRDVRDNSVRELPCQGIFLAIGHVPNTKAFAKDLDTDREGYLTPLSGSNVKTKVPGVYVAGDCADPHYRQAITAAGMGCQAAIEAERWANERG
jgi:thioredoxin reductase (NADPH)